VMSWTYIGYLLRYVINMGLKNALLSIFAGIYSLFLAVFVTVLWISHVVMVCQGQTSMQNGGGGDPIWKNIMDFLRGYHLERVTFPVASFPMNVAELRKLLGYPAPTPLAATFSTAASRCCPHENHVSGKSTSRFATSKLQHSH
jgi:hypothetical protein